MAFLVVGVPGLMVALWVRSLREPARRDSGVAAAPSDSFAEVIAFVRDHRALLAGHFAGYALLALTFNAMAFWLAPYLERVHGLAPASFGTRLGLILAIGGAAGILSGGVLADRLRRRGVADAELWPGVLSALAIWPLGLLTTQASSGAAALGWFAAFMFASSFPFAAAAASLQAVAPNRLRGQLSALYLFVVNLAGVGLGTFLAGFVTDFAFGDESRVGDSLAWIVGLAAPCAALLLNAVRRSYARVARASA
jgi:MFS family permease